MIINQLVPKTVEVNLINFFISHRKDFPIKVFDPIVVEFANDFSKAILRNLIINRNPAFVALAYWLRRSNINRIISENESYTNNNNIHLSPLGVVLHICPSNVDTMFIYSLFISLLTGNKNIVRLSTRSQDPSLTELFKIFTELLLLDKYNILSGYITIFTYERNSVINEELSKEADGRIIWGGDTTVKTFKSIVVNPRSKDIVFSDRTSLALINTSKYNQLNSKDRKQIAKLFFNDAYTFDQKGCSSPQIIITIGSLEDKIQFEKSFYVDIEQLVSKNYIYDPSSLASLKMNQLALDAIDDNISSYYGPNKNLVFATKSSNNLTETCGGGYFYLVNITDLNELNNYTHKKVQTISYYGISEEDKVKILKISSGRGVERLVPIGEALTFDYIWDGYNLIEELIVKKSVR